MLCRLERRSGARRYFILFVCTMFGMLAFPKEHKCQACVFVPSFLGCACLKQGRDDKMPRRVVEYNSLSNQNLARVKSSFHFLPPSVCECMRVYAYQVRLVERFGEDKQSFGHTRTTGTALLLVMKRRQARLYHSPKPPCTRNAHGRNNTSKVGFCPKRGT